MVCESGDLYSHFRRVKEMEPKKKQAEPEETRKDEKKAKVEMLTALAEDLLPLTPPFPSAFFDTMVWTTVGWRYKSAYS